MSSRAMYSGFVWTKKPSKGPLDAAADRVMIALRYMSAICADCTIQSSASSCTIQSESIQRYWIVKRRVYVTASWKVLGRSSHVIPLLRVSSVAFSVFRGWHPPQEWLRHAYRPVWFCVSASLMVSTEPSCPRSKTRNGRLELVDIRLHSVWWVFKHSRNHVVAIPKEASDAVLFEMKRALGIKPLHSTTHQLAAKSTLRICFH